MSRFPCAICLTVTISVVLSGCGGPPSKTVTNRTRPRPAVKSAKNSAKSLTGDAPSKNGGKDQPTKSPPVKSPEAGSKPPVEDTRKRPPRSDYGALGELLPAGFPRDVTDESQRRLAVDPAKLAARGIRRLESKHLTLYTDVPSAAAVDELPRVFDLAVPAWCEYFGIDPATQSGWRITGYLIKDKQLFESVGLLSADLPKFLNGYGTENELWLYEQPSDYYRRHLLLHEGTHAFMFRVLGRAAPPWYMEGMAELLATHRLARDKLTLAYFPQRIEDVPKLGRIRIIQDGFAAQNAQTLRQVFGQDGRAHLQNSAYGWSWALVAFLDGHPRFRQRFRSLQSVLAEADFDEVFQRAVDEMFAKDLSQLSHEWQNFVANIEHNYDLERAAVQFAPGAPLPPGGKTIEVAADRGWQSSGVELEGGTECQLTAEGRYTIAASEVNGVMEPWPCEPGGVTIRYYQGQPLGKLLGCVVADGHQPGQASPFWAPTPIGLSATLTPKRTGTLYLRVNDSAGELRDNQGSLRVRVATP